MVLLSMAYAFDPIRGFAIEIFIRNAIFKTDHYVYSDSPVPPFPRSMNSVCRGSGQSSVFSPKYVSIWPCSIRLCVLLSFTLGDFLNNFVHDVMHLVLFYHTYDKMRLSSTLPIGTRDLLEQFIAVNIPQLLVSC